MKNYRHVMSVCCILVLGLTVGGALFGEPMLTPVKKIASGMRVAVPSPDGKLIAVFDKDARLGLLTAAGERKKAFRFISDVTDLARSLSWSPDGSMLVYSENLGVRSNALKVVSVKTGKVRSFGDGWFSAWSPNSRQLVWYVYEADLEGSIKVSDVGSGQVVAQKKVSLKSDKGLSKIERVVWLKAVSGETGRKFFPSPDMKKIIVIKSAQAEAASFLLQTSGSRSAKGLKIPGSVTSAAVWYPDSSKAIVLAQPLRGGSANRASSFYVVYANGKVAKVNSRISTIVRQLAVMDAKKNRILYLERASVWNDLWVGQLTGI